MNQPQADQAADSTAANALPFKAGQPHTAAGIAHGSLSRPLIPLPPVGGSLGSISPSAVCRATDAKRHQLIDLSVMTDEMIASHGAVSLLEWPLRDAYPQGEHFLDKTKQQLRRLSYSEALEKHPDFKLALFRYTIETYRGSKSPDEVISELIQAVPEEKEAMLTAGQQLEQRGLQQGMQQEKHEIAKRLLERRVSLEDIAQITGLAQKELSHLH